MTAPLPRLPKLLRIALKAGGMDAVTTLARQFGGKSIKVPRRMGDNHPLVAAVGRKVADAICAAVGGEGMVDFPRGSRTFQRLVLDELLMRDPPATLNEIAAALGTSHRHAARLLAKLRAPGEPARIAPRRAADPRQIDWVEDTISGKK